MTIIDKVNYDIFVKTIWYTDIMNTFWLKVENIICHIHLYDFYKHTYRNIISVAK